MKVCAACGTESSEESKFCRHCAKPLAPAQRSSAVTALGTVTAILGTIPLLLGLILTIFGLGLVSERFWGPFLLIVGGFILEMGALHVAAGIGLRRRRRWARYLVLFYGAVLGLSALAGAVRFMSHGAIFAAIPLILSGGYCAWAFIVLLDRRNKAEFS